MGIKDDGNSANKFKDLITYNKRTKKVDISAPNGLNIIGPTVINGTLIISEGSSSGNGIQGPPGATGATGPPGPPGATGATGATGPPGTPDMSSIYTKLEVDSALALKANLANVSGALALKANSVDVFSNMLLKANLASPVLTGVPRTPTAAPGTNTTQIATTEFVQNAINDLNSNSLKGDTGPQGPQGPAGPAGQDGVFSGILEFPGTDGKGSYSFTVTEPDSFNNDSLIIKKGSNILLSISNDTFNSYESNQQTQQIMIGNTVLTEAQIIKLLRLI